MAMRTVMLLRHATAEAFRPGFHDRDRRLTERGEAEAAGVGEWLRQQGIMIDQVLCSSAVRTRQTVAGLDLAADTDFSDTLYTGGADTILTAIRELDDKINCCLVVGHSPTIPSAVRELADPDVSDPSALTTLDRRYPPATLALLEFAATWSNLDSARLLSLRLP